MLTVVVGGRGDERGESVPGPTTSATPAEGVRDPRSAAGGSDSRDTGDTGVPCAGGIVHDDRGRLLLIRRGTAPARGRWSVPGGRCETGEEPAAACVRELSEETGLDVEVVAPAGRVWRDGPGGVTYRIDDFWCRVRGGTLRAATDAADARWVDRAEYDELDRHDQLAPLLTQALASWDALPRR